MKWKTETDSSSAKDQFGDDSYGWHHVAEDVEVDVVRMNAEYLSSLISDSFLDHQEHNIWN